MTDTMKLICKYNITDAGDGKIQINKKVTSAELTTIKAAKPEILAIFEERKQTAEAAATERKNKISAIPGLAEIKQAIADLEKYHYDFEKMMADENNDGVNPPCRPTADIDTLKAQYPVAVAYMRAEAYENAGHYAKSGAGKKAKERILNGEDYTQALADMEAEWDAHVQAHMWD